MIFQASVFCIVIHKSIATIFAAIAYCVLVIFIICPTILFILYPTRLFRKYVSCCGFRRWHALYMFVESFQGQYKDGTNGTRDFRVVSASFLVLRISIMFLSPLFTLTHINQFSKVHFSCIYAITRPYKLNYMNNVDIIILFLLKILIFVTSSSASLLLTYII